MVFLIHTENGTISGLDWFIGMITQALLADSLYFIYVVYVNVVRFMKQDLNVNIRGMDVRIILLIVSK